MVDSKSLESPGTECTRVRDRKSVSIRAVGRRRVFSARTVAVNDNRFGVGRRTRARCTVRVTSRLRRRESGSCNAHGHRAAYIRQCRYLCHLFGRRRRCIRLQYVFRGSPVSRAVPVVEIGNAA